MRHAVSPVRLPALRALLFQCGAVFVVLILAAALEARAGISVSPILAALSQGAVAALLSFRFRLAPWWWLIQLLFPVALLGGSLLAIPPTAFLFVFLVLLAVYWSTFRTQVPFYPSGAATRDAVAALLPAGVPVDFVDVGSGLGDLVMDLAERRPDSRFFGIELAPLPWVISVLRARLGARPGTFIRGDYASLGLARYDVVFAYLSPAAMPGLWALARRQMRPGTLLLSYEFAIPERPPDLIEGPDRRGASLYGWRM